MCPLYLHNKALLNRDQVHALCSWFALLCHSVYAYNVAPFLGVSEEIELNQQLEEEEEEIYMDIDMLSGLRSDEKISDCLNTGMLHSLHLYFCNINEQCMNHNQFMCGIRFRNHWAFV